MCGLRGADGWPCYDGRMSVALGKPMTMAEFLEWEERQELRYEFDGFEPVAMTGGTFAHERIGGNIRGELRNRLRGTPCVVVGPTLKIEVAGRIRYPDAFVLCSPASRNATVMREPVVVFEVLSESTARTDHIEKLREYAATTSIQRYVILEQDSIGAMVFTRKDGQFVAETLTEGDTLHMPEIGVEVAMADFYEGVEMPAGSAGMPGTA